MTYTVKGVKTFHGHDGHGYEASIYNPFGKRVALVVEDGWGGELQFHWKDCDKPAVDVIAYDLLDQKKTSYKGTPEEAKLAAFCATLPKWRCNGQMIHTDPAIHIDALVTDFLMLKDMRRILKKFAVSDGGKIYTWGCPPSHPTIRDIVRKKYPDAIVLNDLPEGEAFTIYKSFA